MTILNRLRSAESGSRELDLAEFEKVLRDAIAYSGCPAQMIEDEIVETMLAYFAALEAKDTP